MSKLLAFGTETARSFPPPIWRRVEFPAVWPPHLNVSETERQ
ncbi:hypothetical protein ACFSQT_33265 [Mesorhizobium calcicola]|uniref:Uncharacterized protein n=1 Tax=Mesorhizobium calcicola TaxID=1300310 RepID=A0ABW4WQC1_9HYPH